MKKKPIFLFILLTTLGFLVPQGCTKNFEDINTDPRIVTTEKVDIDLLLTNVEVNGIVGGSSYGNGTYGCYCGMDKRDDDGPFLETDAPGEWNFEYGNQLNNLSNIIQLIDGKANRADLVNKQAIARILKAWAASKLTDTYGDIPYSESCLPKELAILTPKYDTQKSIYEDLFNELKEAADQFDAGKESYGDADLIYGGNTAKWTKLANSLRLRLALRVSYADPTMAAAQMSDLTEDGLITSIEDDAYIKNSSDYPDHLNPRYYRIINYGTIQESVNTHWVMIKVLLNDTVHMDPRIQIYADTALAAFKGGVSPNGYTVPYYQYRGSPTLGMVTEDYKYPWGSSTVSMISDLWRVPIVAPAVMKASEVYFSLAEAKLAGLLPASFSHSADYYYKQGIDAAIEWAQWFYDLTAPQIPDLMKNYVHNPAYAPGAAWTDEDVSQYLSYKSIKDADITAFKATPAYTLSGSDEAQLEMIINQKLIALYPDEFQGWCEYRRTGFPKVPIGPDQAALKGTVPRREPWPTREETINMASYQQAVAQYGGVDSRLKKMWWDANPNSPHLFVWPGGEAPSQPLPY
jgi:hypothetical protein